MKLSSYIKSEHFSDEKLLLKLCFIFNIVKTKCRISKYDLANITSKSFSSPSHGKAPAKVHNSSIHAKSERNHTDPKTKYESMLDIWRQRDIYNKVWLTFSLRNLQMETESFKGKILGFRENRSSGTWCAHVRSNGFPRASKKYLI